MKSPLLACLSLLLVFSAAMGSEVVVKEDFEGLAVGSQLDALQNWKYFGGWIKPEFGTVLAEGKNKFLRMKGDIFARNQVILSDRLTYRFKIRATGDDEEIGGLTLRTPDGKVRYDVLFSFKHGDVVLAADRGGGKRAQLASGNGIVKNVFQDIVVTVEKETVGVKFSVSIDGNNVFEKQDTEDAAMFFEGFTAGFFTYNNKVIDLDSVEFTRGK